MCFAGETLPAVKSGGIASPPAGTTPCPLSLDGPVCAPFLCVCLNKLRCGAAAAAGLLPHCEDRERGLQARRLEQLPHESSLVLSSAWDVRRRPELEPVFLALASGPLSTASPPRRRRPVSGRTFFCTFPGWYYYCCLRQKRRCRCRACVRRGVALPFQSTRQESKVPNRSASRKAQSS